MRAAPRDADKEYTERLCDVVSKVSLHVKQAANEPSTGLFYVQEHVKKSAHQLLANQCTVRRRRLAPGVDPPRPGSAAGVHAHTALLADDNTRDVARQRRLEEATAEVVALAPDLAECSEMVQQMRRVGPDTLNRMKATLVAASDTIASIREIQRMQHPNRMRMGMRSPATPSFPGSASKPFHSNAAFSTPLSALPSPTPSPAAMAHPDSAHSAHSVPVLHTPPPTLQHATHHRRRGEEPLSPTPLSPSESPYHSHDADWSPVYERLGKERHYNGGGDAGGGSSEHGARRRAPHEPNAAHGSGGDGGLDFDEYRTSAQREERREHKHAHEHEEHGSLSDEGQREDGRSVAGRSTAYSRADTSFYTDDNPNSDLEEEEQRQEHHSGLRVLDGVLHREEHHHAGAMNPDYTPRSRASRSSGAFSLQSVRTDGEPEAEMDAAAEGSGTPGRYHAYTPRPRLSAVSSVLTDGAETDAETEGDGGASPARLQMTRCGDETSVEGSVRGSSTVRGGSLYGGSLYGESLYEGSGSDRHDDDDADHASSDGGSPHDVGGHSALQLAQQQAEQEAAEAVDTTPRSRTGIAYTEGGSAYDEAKHVGATEQLAQGRSSWTPVYHHGVTDDGGDGDGDGMRGAGNTTGGTPSTPGTPDPAYSTFVTARGRLPSGPDSPPPVSTSLRRDSSEDSGSDGRRSGDFRTARELTALKQVGSGSMLHWGSDPAEDDLAEEEVRAESTGGGSDSQQEGQADDRTEHVSRTAAAEARGQEHRQQVAVEEWVEQRRQEAVSSVAESAGVGFGRVASGLRLSALGTAAGGKDHAL